MEVAATNTNLAPYILVVGDRDEAQQSFLVVDRQVVCETKTEDIPLVLMSAFFVFNVCYPPGYSNFYTFMEVFTLGFAITKASPTVKHFVSGLLHD